MYIENCSLWLLIQVGRNSLFIEKSMFIDWTAWGLGDGEAFAIITPLFTFYPWFSRHADVSKESWEARIDGMLEQVKELKVRLERSQGE